MKRSVVLFLLLVVALPASAMRCGSNLIDTGDNDFKVHDRCGEPFWTEQYVRVEVFGARTEHEVQEEVPYEVWYYNFGPQSFMLALTFRNGRLEGIEQLGYGVKEIGGDCDLMSYGSGMAGAAVVAHCGPPAARRRINDTVVLRDRRSRHESYIPDWKEDWVYRFDGGDTRVAHVHNGRLQGIETPR